MKFLRNPVWLAVLVPVLVAAVSLALYFKDRKDRPVKKLRVEILSNSPLVSINTAMAKDMRVLYKGQPIHTLSLILLKFTNAGTQPIEERDYSEPIRVSMSQGAKVGEVSVQETRPDGIQLNPTVTGNQVELARVLLNPGDQAVLKILALNNDTTLKITARIAAIHALDIQSVLGPNEAKGGDLYVPIGIVYVLLAFLVLLVVVPLTWKSRTVMGWRKQRFGFDPPRYYYMLAQGGMLTLPAARYPDQTLGLVIKSLDQCFWWDIIYLERVNSDPLFSQLLGYERFKDVVEKHTGKHS